MVTIRKGKVKKTRTANRPILKTKKQKKIRLLKKDEIALQKQIAEEGLSERAEVPKGNISLRKDDSETFRKKNKSFTKKAMSGTKGKVIPSYRKGAPQPLKKPIKKGFSSDPGVICITNLPHGFFEKQLEGYFTQFGAISRVRLVRSKISGRSCGYAYVEFYHADVAKIAAKAMNNYLTYGKIMKCILLDYSETLADSIFSQVSFGPKNCPKVKSRAKAIKALNKRRTEKQVADRTKRVTSSFKRKLKQLGALGVKVDVKLLKPEGTKKPIIKRERKVKTPAEDKENKILPPAVIEIIKSKARAKAKSEIKAEESEADLQNKKENSATPETKVAEEAKEIVAPDTEVTTETNASTEQDTEMKNKRKSVSPQTPQTEEEKDSGISAKTPKKKKLEAAEVKTPQTTGKSQKKSGKTPKKSEGNTAVADTKVANEISSMTEGEVVFEADESDDEITVKTPAYAIKKLVKITPSSPANRVTGVPKIKSDSVKKMPQETQQLTTETLSEKNESIPQKGHTEETLPITPVAGKNTRQNRRKSMLGASIQKSAKKQKKRCSM